MPEVPPHLTPPVYHKTCWEILEGLDALARGDVHSLDAVEAEMLPKKEV